MTLDIEKMAREILPDVFMAELHPGRTSGWLSSRCAGTLRDRIVAALRAVERETVERAAKVADARKSMIDPQELLANGEDIRYGRHCAAHDIAFTIRSLIPDAAIPDAVPLSLFKTMVDDTAHGTDAAEPGDK